MRDLKLFTELREARDVFTKTVEDELAKRDQDLKEARDGYKGKVLQDRIKLINSNYERARAKAGERFNSRIDPLITGAENAVKDRVANPNGSKLRELRAISDIPMTAKEFSIIGHRFCSDYWCASLLREVAAKNNISAEDINFKIEPSADVELNILDEIKAACVEFVSSDDVTELKHMMLLSDKKIMRWEALATNGLISESSMSDEWLVSKAYSHIASAWDEQERAARISAELSKIEKTRPAAKIELMSRIANSNVIGDTAIGLCGSAELKEMRRTGSNKEYEKAKVLVGDVVSTLAEKGEVEAVRKLDAALAEDNKYFQTVMQKAAADNEALLKAAVAVDTARGSNLSGGNVTA